MFKNLFTYEGNKYGRESRGILRNKMCVAAVADTAPHMKMKYVGTQSKKAYGMVNVGSDC